MLKHKGFNLKKIMIQIVLLHICAAFLLSSCVKTDCSLMAVAGGSQYCEETVSGN